MTPTAKRGSMFDILEEMNAPERHKGATGTFCFVTSMIAATQVGVTTRDVCRRFLKPLSMPSDSAFNPV